MTTTPRRGSLRALSRLMVMCVRLQPRKITGVVILTLAEVLLLLGFPLLVRTMVNGFRAGKVGDAAFLAVGLGVTLLAHEVVGRALISLRMVARETITFALDREIASRVSAAPGIEHFESPEYLAELEMLRVQREVLAVLPSALFNLVGTLIRIVVMAVLLAMIWAPLIVVPLLALPALALSVVTERRQQAALRRTMEPRRFEYDLWRLSTTAAPSSEVRVWGLAPTLLERHRAVRSTVDGIEDRAGRSAALRLVATWGVVTLGYGFALLAVALRVPRGAASAGDVALVLLLGFQMQAQLAPVMTAVQVLQRSVSVAGRFLWLEAESEDLRARAEGNPVGNYVPDRLTDGIHAQGLTYVYPGTDRPALSEIDLFFPAGSVTAIVGENGAGKSTLVNVLCRFLTPTAGRVLLDDHDVADFEIDALRSRATASFQNFMRYEFILHEVVGVGDLPRIDDEQAILTGICRAGASGVLHAVDGGLDAQLGRSSVDGQNLSTGQWQQLAAARAMMRDVPFLLVFDEPTASLDAPTEHALFERYSQAGRRYGEAGGAVTLLVTHRYATVRSADQIVVLDQGRVVEKGTHDELMASKGQYAELFALQHSNLMGRADPHRSGGSPEVFRTKKRSDR